MKSCCSISGLDVDGPHLDRSRHLGAGSQFVLYIEWSFPLLTLDNLATPVRIMHTAPLPHEGLAIDEAIPPLKREASF